MARKRKNKKVIIAKNRDVKSRIDYLTGISKHLISETKNNNLATFYIFLSKKLSQKTGFTIKYNFIICYIIKMVKFIHNIYIY